MNCHQRVQRLERQANGDACRYCAPLWRQPIEIVEVEAPPGPAPTELYTVERGVCPACGRELPITQIVVHLPCPQEEPPA